LGLLDPVSSYTTAITAGYAAAAGKGVTTITIPGNVERSWTGERTAKQQKSDSNNLRYPFPSDVVLGGPVDLFDLDHGQMNTAGQVPGNILKREAMSAGIIFE
jgi:hypothetical protein